MTRNLDSWWDRLFSASVETVARVNVQTRERRDLLPDSFFCYRSVCADNYRIVSVRRLALKHAAAPGRCFETVVLLDFVGSA